MKRLILIFAVLFAAISLTLIGIQKATPVPPTETIQAARQSIALAKALGADTYSTVRLQEARTMFDSAIALWEAENDKCILRRNYEHALSCARIADTLAQHAGGHAIRDKTNLKTMLRFGLDSTQNRIRYYKSILERIPKNTWERESLQRTELLYSEANQAYQHGDLKRSAVKTEQADKALQHIARQVDAYLEAYFMKFPEWQEIAASTIRESKVRNALVIDKFNATCYLYRRGRLIKSYDVEFGPNWLGEKIRQGDKSTPEGIYSIINKKKGAQTGFYKALLINYPNESDIVRFEMGKKNGVIDNTALIGGLIEIHGGGGRGMHWTDGCIALTDKEMDYLYGFAEIGSPVAIVGSLVSLGDIRKSIQFHVDTNR